MEEPGITGRFALTQTPGGAPPRTPPLGDSKGYSHKFTNSQTVKRRPGIETREDIHGHPWTFVTQTHKLPGEKIA